jgi:uncharacterized membrane protein
VLVAFTVKLTGDWTSGLFLIAMAAAFGAVLWFFLHPEQPLEYDAADSVPLPNRPRSQIAAASGQPIESD